MTWHNPWAWLGLGALALPVIIHLLGRGRSRVHRFPTLRFIDASRLLPSRRTRLHDVLLLAVRLAILVVAVAALAQPMATNRMPNDRALARAIVIDSSASMRRLTSTGESALLAARREATRLTGESAVSTVIEVASPASAIPGAVAWLQHQSGQGELHIISDFQVGAIDSVGLAAVPPRLGVHLTRIAAAPLARSSDVLQQSMHGVTTAHITADTATTDVIWTTIAAPPIPGIVTMLAGTAQESLVAATRAASRSVGLPMATDSAHVVAIVFPGFPESATLRKRARPIGARWMTSRAARLQHDPLLVRAAAESAPLPSLDSTGLVIVRDTGGAWLVTAAEDSTDGHERLLLFSRAEPGTVLATALAAAVVRANGSTAPLAELEPGELSGATLAAWQHAASTEGSTRTVDREGASDARWFWLLALLLLGLEWLIRSRVPRAQVGIDVTA